MPILVTGAAGYIGSHTCLELLQAGESVVALDNFSNSSPEPLSRVQHITGRALEVVRGDVRDAALLRTLLQTHDCTGVIHFAGLKSVGESVRQPLSYYDNNVAGAVSLLQVMRDCGVKRLIFSSSATVYGEPQELPLRESHPRSATNPYGRSKLMIEEMLEDLHQAEPDWNITILRYFNPVGAHPSGLIGEDPRGVPNNLMPFVAQVAVGRRDCLNVWGYDYPTTDGTGVRDYIHVVDLARGHLAALQQLRAPQCVAINLGTGRGYSVLEVVRAFEMASDCAVPYRLALRRPGDVAVCYADASRAQELLGWQAEHDIGAMCADHWRWQRMQPEGFEVR